jgi:plastocyanin domain-containing protein
MKLLVLLVLAPLVLFVSILIVLRGTDSSMDSPLIPLPVEIVDGKQIITINAKGGYRPQSTIATADMPTAISVQTHGTFDCSSSLVFPSLGIHKILPPSGSTLIDIPPQPAGTTLKGLCAMGMYSFAVKFE